jgi:hypothetical protein
MASCPFLSTDIAKLIFANTSHVIAAHCSFEDISAFGALLVLEVFF